MTLWTVDLTHQEHMHWIRLWLMLQLLIFIYMYVA
jgi:hypothetical protein